MRNILIGSDGFVGTNLRLRKNHDYLSFDNGFLKKELNSETIFLDLTKDMSSIETHFKEAKGNFNVINLAAIHHIPYCNANPSEAMMTNVMGNLRLYELAAKYNCSNFIFASSGAVYDPGENRHTELDRTISSDVYSATKILAESHLQASLKVLGVPVVILRFFNIVGAYDLTPHLVPDIVNQVLDESLTEIRLGNLSTKRDYIGVDDVCSVIEHFINNSDDADLNIFNVGSGEGLSGHQVFDLVSKISKTNKVKVIDKERFRKSDRPVQIADNKKLIDKIGEIKFIKFEKSLTDYLNWRGIL
jgi:UDP-glucose 4-epimerase